MTQRDMGTMRPPGLFAGRRAAYDVGDDTWIYLGDHKGKRTKGRVVAALDLPGYLFRNYVVEIDTSIDPLLEVRNSFQMWEGPALPDETYEDAP